MDDAEKKLFIHFLNQTDEKNSKIESSLNDSRVLFLKAIENFEIDQTYIPLQYNKQAIHQEIYYHEKVLVKLTYAFERIKTLFSKKKDFQFFPSSWEDSIFKFISR